MDSNPPPAFQAILHEAEVLGFPYSSEPLTGALLRVLAASKPGGRLLEIGTGAGVGTCWLLDGMDAASTLTTIELDAQVSAIARQYLGGDSRATFITGDAEDFLQSQPAAQFDLIFADTFPGKFYLLDEALALLKPGGLYVIDDLLPQPTWGEGHEANVDRLLAELDARRDLRVVRLDWASGLMICAKL
ncbi:MAG: class I SAM-dependent methyltransferase [Anaerolineae bacterium]